MKRSVLPQRRGVAARRPAPARRPRPLGVSLSRFTSAAAICGALVAGVGSAKAATYYWDADGISSGNNFTTGFGLGGSGVWNTSIPLWWDTTADFAWPNAVAGDTAVFTGLAGVVQLGGNITVGGITFNSAGYNITDGSAGSKLTLTGGGSIFNNVAGTNTIATMVDGTSGLTLTGTGLTSVLALTNAANTYTGTTTITSGTLNIAGDGSLGNAANGITFNGAALGGLTFAQSTTLGAGRTVTLGAGATATLTSALNAGVYVLGPVTGAGNLTVAGSGVTSLLNTANDFSGTLWAQNGTVSLASLADAVGSGNLKLGNGGSAGGFQWASGATSALNLTNRTLELAGTTGSATIDSSAITAANTVTINNLAITGNGNKTLTLTGANAGTNTLNAGIVDSTGTTGFTKSGTALWVLGGNNTFTGNITIAAGTTRVTGNSFGTGASSMSFSSTGAGNLTLLEFRNENSINFGRNITNNAGTNQTIFVDRAIGGSASGQTFALGSNTQTASSSAISIVGDHGYGMTFGTTILNHNGTAGSNSFYVYNNDLGSPGYTAPGYANGVLTLTGVTTDNVANTGGVTQNLQGWGDYVINGAITSPVAANGLPLNINKNGLGVLTLPGATGTGTGNGWTIGTLTLTAGTTRFTVADTIGTGGATLTLSGGLLELRSDTSLNSGPKIGSVTAASTVFVDHSIGGTSTGGTMTLGTLAANNTTTLNVVGDRGNSLTLGLTTITGTKTFTLNNYLSAPGYSQAGYTPGVLNLSGLTTDNTATAATLVMAGFGDFNAFDGSTNAISSPNAATPLNITKSALGVQTFSGNNSGWTVGTLTSAGGTTLIDTTNANAVGLANLSGTGGLLQILGASGTANAAPWSTKSLTLGGAYTLALDPLAGSGALAQTVNLGGLTGGNTTLLIDSNHGYNLTFNGAGTTAASTTLTNIGNGTVTFGAGLTTTVASTYTLNGVGDFNVAGPITNGAGTVTLTKTGYGVVTLGAANTIGGTITDNSGSLRVTNAGAFGGAGTLTFNGGNSNANGTPSLDLRNDVGMDLSSRSFTTNDYNFLINVDRGLAGSGVNQTMSLGGGSVAGANGWGFAVLGAHGYSLQFGSATNPTAFQEITNVAGYTVSNFIPSIAGNGAIVFNSGITFTAVATASGLNLAGTGDYVLSGALTNTGATALTTLNKNGTGTLTLSGNNSTSFNIAADSILTMGSGLTRVTTANSLGGANTTLNLNAAALSLRSNAAMNFSNSTVNVGSALGATINVDAGVGSTGAAGTTHTLSAVKDNGVVTLFTTGGSQSGANAYNLGVTTFTVGGANTALIPTVVNSIGNGGALNIGTLTGGAGFNAVFNGPGATNVTTAMTLNTGTLTKSGTGTLTISGNTGTNSNGAVTVNGGTLALDYSTGAASNILQSAALTLNQGTFLMKGNTTTAGQSLTTLTLSAGQDNVTMVAGGGAANTLTFTGAVTANTAGSTALISAPATTSVITGSALNTAATTGRNLVFFDGTNYNWAANTGAATAFVANNDATAPAAVQYATLNTAAGTDTSNSQLVNAAATGLAGARTTNSLMINTSTAGGTLDLSTFNLTLTQGGVLFTGANPFTISNTQTTTGLKSNIGTNSDTVINNYGTGAGVLTISAPIITGNGTTTLTLGGTGKTIIGNAALAELGTYAGITYINGGTVQLASGVQHLGATTASSLSVNGGTLDLNGNNLGIGNLNATTAGSGAGIIDNTSANPASLTINAAATSVFNGTIQNSGGGKLSVIKTGTQALTLGDAITGGSNTFTGDLSITGASTVTLNSLADAAGSKVNFGATGAGLTFVGRSNLSLTNRAFDITAAGGSATISSSSAIGSVNGTNAVLFIGSNLAPTGTGALSLTLAGTAGNVPNGGTGTGAGDGVSGITGTGNVALVNAFNGNISDGAATSLALTVSGSGGWSLGGNNTYSGNTILSSTGLVRATSATAFGAGSVNLAGTGILDLRSDTGLTFANQFQLNSSTTINVDRAIGGSGYGQVMNIGPLTELTGAKTLTVTNLTGTSSQLGNSDNVVGYGLHIAGLTLNAGSATTITNGMGAPGAALMAIPAAGTGVAGALVIDGVAAGGPLGNYTLTLNSVQDSANTTIINGDITQAGGTTLGLTLSPGNSFNQVTLSGQTAATNFSGGITLGSTAAYLRVTNQYALGSGAFNFNGGTLEVRNDSSMTYANSVVLGAAAATTTRLSVGEAINGTSGRGNTFAFGPLVLQGITGNGLTVGGIGASNDNSGNSVSFGGVQILANVNDTITNNLLLPGTLNLGDVGNTFSTTASTQTLTIAGSGVTTLGNVTNAAANGLTAINYNGTGILDLSRATGANTYTGGLTINTGTVRANSANNFGGASNVITFTGTSTSTLELRSDTGFTIGQQMNIGSTGSTISLGQLPGPGSASYGANFVLGGIVTPSNTGKTLTVNGLDGTTAANGDNLTISRIDFGTGGAFNTLLLTNNLLLPSLVNVGSVTNTLAASGGTLTINGSGATTLDNVADGALNSTAVVYSGTGFLNLTGGFGNTFSGGFKLTSGTARALTANSLGLGPLTLGGGTLEIRSDSDVSYPNVVNLTANTSVTLGQLPGGTGATGRLVTLGNITATAGTLTVAGIGGTSAANGYGLSVGTITLAGAATALTNNTPTPSAVTIASIMSGIAGTNTFTIGGTSSLTTVTGPITDGSGVTALTVSAASGGTVVLAGGGSSFSGGLNLTGTGILRILDASNFGASTGTVALTNGTLDVRTDATLSVPNPITVATNSVTINVDQVTSGNSGKIVTFAGPATTLNTSGKTLFLTSSNGYGMTFTNGLSLLTAGYIITNNASGPVNLGAINYTAAAGALTINGSGATTVGNLTGTTAPLALTYGGNGLLDLTGNNGVSNPMSALTVSGAGGIVRVASAANLGAANDQVTFSATGTLQVRSNGAGSNGTIVFGNPIALTANGGTETLDLANGGSNTGNTVIFGAVNNGGAAQPNTLVVNGANGYAARFTSLTLPNGTGNNTTVVANAPVTFTGNVTNAQTGFAVTNFDTLFLDGGVGGTITGTITDSATGSLTLNGLTRLTKQGSGTWTLGSTSNYLGVNTITGGTLKLGANNALGSAGMGTSITAAAGATATLDLAGFNQTLGLGTGTISGIQTSALILGGGAASQPQVIDSVGTGTLTLAGTSTTGDIQYVSTNNPFGGLIGVRTLDLGNAPRTFNVADSSNAAADLTVSSAILSGANGTITKTGTGALLLSGALTLPTTATTFFNISGATAGSLIASGPVTSSTVQTWSNASTAAGVLQLAGKLNMGANALTVSGAGETLLSNTAAGSGANVLGPINVTGGVLAGLNVADGAGTGSSALGTSSIALSGTNPTLRLAPSFGATLPGGVSAGLAAKGYTGVSTLAATNFLGAPNPVTTNSGVFAYLNLPTGSGTIANLPTITAASTFSLNTSYQFTGLLNITNAGVYNFSTTTDDGGLLVIDGNTINTSVSTAGSGMYLTAGLHVFNERMNNATGNGTVSLRYQGADTANALVDIPASALFQANSAADLATTFNNNITLAATTNATIDVSSNTTIAGALTMTGSGTGTTLNVLGSGNLNTVTLTGTTTLTGDLAVVTPTANLTLAGQVTGGFGISKSGFGTLILSGANNNYTGATTLSAGTLSFVSGGLGTGAINLSGGTLRWESGNTQDISSRLTTLTGTSTFDTNGNNVTFASPFTAATITKTGLGALTLGPTTLTGNLNLNQGTLNITGPVTGAATTLLAYGGTANPTVVNVNGNFTGFGTTGANVAGSVAVYNQNGGTVTVTPGTTNAGQYVAGAAGYGYFNLTGNAVYKASTTGQRFNVTAGASTGVAYIGGNSLLTSGEHFLVAYNGTGALGEITIADTATVDHSNATANFEIFWVSNNAYGVFNQAGGTLNNTGRGIVFGGGAGNNQTGFANLAGGTVIATGFTGSTGTGTGNKSFINFAGGTYKASAAQTLVGPDGTGNMITTTLFGAVDNSSIGGPSFAGGLTVDTNGVAVTSNRPIAGAASSFGVTQANLTIPGAASGNANYIGAPAVQFSAPAAGGVPAAGYALISGGKVTGVVITDPGTYATGETPTITFTGGGGSIAPFTTSNVTTANLDAGLTVTGGGSLLLSAANTFGGTTSVIGGATLKIGNTAALSGPLSLGSAGTVGTLDVNGSTANVSNLLVGAGATAGNQIVTNSSATALGTLALNLSGAYTLPAIQINNGGTQKTALALTGPAAVTQTGTYAYTGGTLIQNGSLRLAGADNLLNATSPVTLGNLTNSGKLILGGDGVGGTGAGTQRLQTLTQTSATPILSTSGTGLYNSVVGGSAGGTSSGTPDNNSVLTLNIGSGFTDTYAGLIGWDGQGTLGFQNNINLVKTGNGTLFLTGDLTNWTGTGSGPTDPTRPKLLLQAGVLALGGTINTAVLNTGGVINDQGYVLGPNGSIVTTGGLVTLSAVSDTFASAGITSASHGVVALNSNNSGVVGFENSDMYLGAVGIRNYSGTQLAAGSGNTYRFGGGAPWNALGSASLGGSGGYLQVSTANVVTGAGNAVVIGDNSGSIFGGLSTVEFTAPQNFGGTLSILGGTLQFTADNQLGSQAATANSLLLDGGAANNGFNATLRYGPNTTVDESPRIGIVSGGTIDTGANNVTFGTALANVNGGTGGLNKIGTGTLTLNKQNTYAGPTGVTQGTLLLDLTGVNNVISPTSAGLLLGGGNLSVKAPGAAAVASQTLSSTTFASGGSTITPILNAAPTTGTLTFALGTLNRNAGATGNIVFDTTNNKVTATSTQITQSTTGGAAPTLITSPLGSAYLTFGTTAASVKDWAVIAAGSNQIVQAPASFYTPATATTLSGNADVVTGTPTPTITGAAGDNAIPSIRLSSTAASTLTLNGATSTFSVGGILLANGVGNVVTTLAGTATLQGPSGGTGDLVIQNWNAGFVTAAGASSGSTSTYLKIGGPIGGTGGVTFTGAPTALTFAAVNGTWTGVTTINGAFVDIQASVPGGVPSVLGSATADPANLVLNGGGIYMDGGSNVALGRLFSLGVNGGTLTAEKAGAFTLNGTFNGSNAIGFVGAGARTLTLSGSGQSANTLGVSLGDNGGPTSLFKMGTGLWVLGVNNSYTGTTTIANGILRLAIPNALPGGVGVIGATSTSTSGGGNLTFAGGAAQAVLELTAGSGNFYRTLGSGPDQVQWTGNGGFSAAGADMSVNLGGNAQPTTLVWGSTAGFVSTGSLMLGSATASNKVIFQNPLDFNGGARTVAVDNGSAVIEAELSGTLSNSSATPSTFTKSGNGVLLLSGTNNTQGVINTTTSGGTLLLPNTNAIPGTGGRSVTVGANSAVVLQGATDLSPLLSRLNTASTGVVAFDTSSSTAVDLSDPALANVYLGAFSNPGGTPIYYNGTITPGTNNTYKFANAGQGSPGTATGGIGGAVNLLVLNGRNTLTNNGATPRSVILGGNSTAQGGTGSIYLTSYNTYSGGTIIGQATGAAGTNTEIGVGNDSAFGTGLLTLNDGRLGALNGDHTLSNNLKSTGTTGNMAVGGTLASDFIANPGALTYLGTADFSSLTTGGIFTRTAAVPAIFLGDVKTNAANNLTVLTSSSGPVSVVEFLTTPAGSVPTKTMNAGNKGFTIPGANPGGSMIVIDSAGSLGAGPSVSVPGFITLGGVTNATLQVLPGITSTITLPANEGLNTSSGALFAFTVNGAPGINDSTNAPTSGLIGNSELVFPGVLSGASSGGPSFSKLGYGTLTLQGQNTTTMSAANGLAISNGTLKLDFANSPANASIFTVTNGMLLGSAGINTQVGILSSYATGPATLSLLGKSGQTNAQTFGPVTNAAKDNAIVINSNGGTVNLTLGLITNTIGGTIAVTPAAQGTFAIAAANTTLVNGVSGTTAGVLADANLNPYVIVGGTDWGAKDASNNVVAATAFYTNNPDGSSFTANSQANLVSPVTLAANTTVGSLRINTNATPLNLTGNLVTGGILMGTGTGANDQLIAGPGNLQGTQVGAVGKNLAIYQANPAAKLTISAVIANNAAATTTPATALSKAGPGTLVLSGTNTYSGVTYFNGGAISVGAVTVGGTAGPLGAASNAPANWVFNGGTLQYTGATGTTDHGATFNAVSAIDVTQGGSTLTMASSNVGVTGVISTPGLLRKLGPGALTIAGTASDTNLSVEVAAGTLNLGKTSGFAVQQTTGAALIVDSGATARVTGTVTTQIDPSSSVVIKTGGQLDLNAVGLTFDGLAGGGTVTSATGTPVLTLGSANDAAISAYTVGASAAGVASTGLNNFSGVISGSIALTKAGAGTQIIGGGISTYTGATTINTGTLKMGGANALPSGSGKGDVTIAGNLLLGGLIVPGTLDLGGYDQAINGLNSTTGGIVANTPTVMYTTAWGTPYGTAATTGTSTLSVGNGNASGSFNGSLQDGFSVLPVAGAGAGTGVNGLLALDKVGTGTQVLSGNNTYSGGTTIDGGTIQINSSSSLGAIAGGVVINAGTLQATADITTTRNFQLGSASSTVAVDAAKTYTVSGGFSDGAGTGTLNKSGLGTLVLTGSNGYTGGTNVAAGTLQVGNGGTAGTLGNGAITTGTNATLAINHSDSVTIPSAIGGTGNFAQLGGGTTVLTGANAYAGTTTISNGTLQVGNGGTVGSLGTGAVTNNANLSFQRTDTATVASAIGGSGTVTQTGGILNLNGAVTGQALHVASGQVNLGTGDTTATNPNHSLTALTIDSGSTVQIAAGPGVKLVQATSLTLASTAKLDLTNNAFVLNYPGSVEDPTKTAAIASLLQTGFNGGSWNGIGGITTSKVASDMAANPTSYQYLTGIGYMSGAMAGGSFLGRAVDPGSVVARYTYYGDANLDGVVNGLDYALIDSGFSAQNNAGFVYSWANGDFNYDGHIDGADYALMDTAAAFSNGVPVVPDAASFDSPSSLAAGPEAQPDAAPTATMGSLPTAVPEPASFGMLLLGGAMLGLRRRRAK